MPILGRSNYFQLYNRRHADFQLGVNRSRMDAGQRFLWHNIEIMHKVIEEAGLQDKLEREYQNALDNYAQNENERYERHRSQINDDEQPYKDAMANLQKFTHYGKQFIST